MILHHLDKQGHVVNLTTLTITAVILVMIGLDVNQATPEARIPRTIRTNEIDVSSKHVCDFTHKIAEDQTGESSCILIAEII